MECKSAITFTRAKQGLNIPFDYLITMVKAKKKITKSEITSVIDYIRDRAEFILAYVRKKVDEIKSMILKKIIIFSILWFGAFFILLGIAQKVVELYPGLKASGGLFIVGIALVIIGLIYYAGTRK